MRTDMCDTSELRHSLVKKSQWIFGGDGWGYDIGFGGLGYSLADGLRKPEFHQDEDFRAILWRPEVQEGGTERGKVTGKVAGKVAGKVDKNTARIILAIRGNTVSSREIMDAMHLKGGDNFRKRYLYPSIEAGYVSKLYPDSESRPDQAYYLTEKGLQLLSELLKK